MALRTTFPCSDDHTDDHEEIHLRHNTGLYATDYGLVADGTSNPLSGVYATLAAAQAVYTCAVGLTDEIDWCAIQTALDAAGTKPVYINGQAITNRPLVMSTQQALIGVGQNTRITKNSNTAGSGTRAYGAATDDYAIDAIIQIDHAVDTVSSRVRIENVRLISSLGAGYVAVGIYAPRVRQLSVRNVDISLCTIGIKFHTIFLSGLVDVYVTGHSTTTAFQIANDGTGQASTSTEFHHCFANTGSVGYDLFGLRYSSLVNCAADHIGTDGVPGKAYWLRSCSTVVLSGCGAEDCTGEVIQTSLCRILVNCMDTDGIDGVTAGTHGYITLDGGQAVFSACRFRPFDTPRNSFNERLLNGAETDWTLSMQPAGGA